MAGSSECTHDMSLSLTKKAASTNNSAAMIRGVKDQNDEIYDENTRKTQMDQHSIHSTVSKNSIPSVVKTIKTKPTDTTIIDLKDKSSKTSKASSATHRRLLEARAEREAAELEKLDLELEAEKAKLNIEKAQIKANKALVYAKLKEELALMDDNSSQMSQGNNNDDERYSHSHSTNVETWIDNNVYKGNTNDIPKNDEYMRNDLAILTHAITNAIKISSGSSSVSEKLLRRITAKDLPMFSGDALDWLRFKNTYETTTALGQYTDQENVARLQTCLTGQAWDAVSGKLITATSADKIMKTLEMRFGRPDLVLRRVINEMKRVPKLTGSRSELINLATKVSNCVAAIEATKHFGHLHNPDLITEVIDKMTEALVYRWLDYSRKLGAHQPRLLALADYLMNEADGICQAGATELPTKSNNIPKRHVLAVNEEEEEDHHASPGMDGYLVNSMTTPKCAFCNKEDHYIVNCSTFKDMDVDKRWEWICAKRFCFRCLKSPHRRDRCKTKKKCNICRYDHHTLLHKAAEITREPNSSTDTDYSETTANVWNKEKRVYLKVLPVEIEGPAGKTTTYALLDEGSTVTLVEHEIADKVGIKGPELGLNLKGAVGEGNYFPSQLITLTLRTTEGVFQLQRVRTVDNLTLPNHTVTKTHLDQYEHLKGIPLEAFEGRPTILIGQDHWHLIISREIREGKRNEPVASRTQLGWVLHGFTSSITNPMPEYTLHVRHENDEELHNIVKNYFNLESIGIKHAEARQSAEENRAMSILETKSKRISGRWETGLLWRSDNVEFPDNNKNAVSRLRVIERMMDADPDFATEYAKQVVNMIEKGYAEEVVKPEAGNKVWYLPHFAVKNKPGKTRLVFDAKAETNGISLNTELLSGPDLLNSLVGVLMRFRERRVAVTGDIREMFLQVKIIDEDQKAQYFLWRGMDRYSAPRIYKNTSMIFGATSSPCTATYILRRNADDFKSTYPRAVTAIKQRHYVDDYLDSVDSDDEMKQLINDVATIHQAGGFEIRGWASNRPNVLPQAQQSKTDVVTLIKSNDGIEKTLGMSWKPGEDTLGFDLSLRKIDKDIADGLRKPTKREMLKVVMSVFDPLGLLCPFLIQGKILLQDVWRSGIQWDQQVGEKFAETWFRWLQDLKKCQTLYISRSYGFKTFENFELHVFVDASEQAYAAVTYLRQEGEVAFVVAKCRVAPLKSATVPRLELQAALMGARLGAVVEKEIDFKIIKRWFWTDSRTVWHWIQNNPRHNQPFISNRLSEIDELTKPQEWRWLPGQLNVADEATRGGKRLDTNKSKWLKGPDFLKLPELEWPLDIPLLRENEEELSALLDDDERNKPSEMLSSVLPEIDRFSRWLRLIRATAYVLLFIEKIRHKVQNRLETRHMERAERLWIMQTQIQGFPKEIARLKAGLPIQKTSRIYKLNPFFDANGVMRLKGRANALIHDIERNVVEPIILDGRLKYSRLLTHHYHEQALHGNTETVVNRLREKYWIIHLRPTVRTIEHSCQFCRIRKAGPIIPPTGNLPPARLAIFQRPFSHCGIDYFGPMIVAIGRRREKRYGALFTCMTTRAVHIELAGSLTTDSMILALKRMIARRGCPKVMYSDNGTNFRGANTELKKAAQELNEEEINNFLVNREIEWRFNPPAAPHMGGCWERLVRSFKKALSVTLMEQAPREEVLLTLLLEAEQTINSRPLTHVSVNPDDLEALTPMHFLLGNPSGALQVGSFNDSDLTSRKYWRKSQRLADMFWRRWIREYLPTLLPRTTVGSGNPDTLREGDVALIVDPNLPRNIWPMGIIDKVFPGPDGKIRVVEVRTKAGTLKRPVTKIVPLPVTAALGP